MKVINGYENLPAELTGAIVTIGNFDGIHLGHQAIFRNLVEEARRDEKKAIVITFDPHPKMLLHPERRPFYLITSLEEKIKLIGDLGFDALILIPFSLEFAETTAEDFIKEILWKKLRITKIFIGHDYTFGKGKGGNEQYLTTFGGRLGFTVDVINAVAAGDIVVSSTGIRNAILCGDVKTAAMLLGRPYNLRGPVIVGKRRGASLGFPTANVEPNKELIPARGIYAAFAVLDQSRYQAALNIGYNPTFADEKLSVEVHLLDFNGDIYGRNLDILFIDRIRNEEKFNSPAKLIEQIGRDVEKAREILKSSPW